MQFRRLVVPGVGCRYSFRLIHCRCTKAHLDQKPSIIAKCSAAKSDFDAVTYRRRFLVSHRKEQKVWKSRPDGVKCVANCRINILMRLPLLSSTEQLPLGKGKLRHVYFYCVVHNGFGWRRREECLVHWVHFVAFRVRSCDSAGRRMAVSPTFVSYGWCIPINVFFGAR